LETSVFFDSDHAHDHKTQRSITGIIVFVGSTPVLWPSKHQGCIATLTYTAEFVAMRSAIEEAISIRYMLLCLGILVMKPTNLYGDNFGVIQSATIPEGELKKKLVAIAYHYVRESMAAGFINAIWVKSYENFVDVFTKALGAVVLNEVGFTILWHSVIFPFLKLRLCLRGGHVPGDGLAIHPKRRSGFGLRKYNRFVSFSDMHLVDPIDWMSHHLLE
jgi:hypothetical protein